MNAKIQQKKGKNQYWKGNLTFKPRLLAGAHGNSSDKLVKTILSFDCFQG